MVEDEYGCNSNKCQCKTFEQAVIGKLRFVIFSFKPTLGDIAVSGKTVSKLLKTSGDPNAGFWKAYPDSAVDIWDQNWDQVNRKYVIAYEMNMGLDSKLKEMLPKV